MRMLLNVSIPHEPFKAAALHSDAAGRTMPRFISVRFVDSHFAQWYCDAVEGITAHSILDRLSSSDRASSSPIEQA